VCSESALSRLSLSVELEQTDRADLMLIESYLILVVMSFVIGDHLGFTWGSFPCSL